MVVSLTNATELLDSRFDVVVIVNDSINELPAALKSAESALTSFTQVNPKLSSELNILPFPEHPSKRLIFSPTGQLNTDTADIRNVYDAAAAGIERAIKLGFRSPLLCLGSLKSVLPAFTWCSRLCLTMNAVLGAYHALYTPIEVREMVPSKFPKAKLLGVLGGNDIPNLMEIANGIEEGRAVARDIGGSDPERMAAPKIAEYLAQELANLKGVKMTVENVDGKKYPLMEAVDRAAAGVARHAGRVIHIEYQPSSNATTTLFLVGKGITYDTGGCDVKSGGVMAGMHRDKCGAAAVAGLFKTLGILQPPNLKVVASLAFVRNSIGSNAYVADEIIVSRAGERVRVGNTDAEGRMVMADLLCEAKEKALKETNPFLFTIATLTGHAVLAYKHFTAVLDNGPARMKGVSRGLQDAGDWISDIAEISTVRKEDFEFHKGKSEYEDILQCNNSPSSRTPRGHQTPAAFLAMASGVYKHGLDSSKPLPYTHVDVAGSAAEIHVMPTASPLMMFTSQYILPQLLPDWLATAL